VVLIVRSVGWTYYLSSQVGHLYFESASLQTPQEIAMSVGALFGGYMRRGWRNRFGYLSGRIACESRHLRRSCGEHFRDLHDESINQSINANIKSYSTHQLYRQTTTTPTMPPPRYRSLLDLAMNRASYTCNSCTRTLLQQRTFLRPQQQSRFVQTSQRNPQHAAPSMSDVRRSFKKRNENSIYYTISIILGTVALSYGSVPLYKTLCQETGWGGTPTKSSVHTSPSEDEDIAAKLTPVTSSRRLRITFQGSTSDVLPWKFTPQQREVRVLPGETALAFYTATNKSDEDVIGVATYSVTPGQVAPYFSKIQCFCFEEQRLNAGETVDMPVFFYIDPEFLKDPAMKGIDTITLNYTFFSKSAERPATGIIFRLESEC
jgi:cytochrome c oxidase assembly protein subunit 11